MQNKHNSIKIQKIIAESLKKQQKQQREYYLFGKFFYVKDAFVTPLNVQSVIDELEEKMPAHLIEEIDEILVGDFEFLSARSIEAMYKDGAIYITNQIQTEKDLIENIFHETSHSLEYSMGQFIYGDMKMHSEFRGKRERLEQILKSEGYDTEGYDFSNLEYDELFDEFLFKEVGYPVLSNLVMGLFVSPYAATSLREYWAVGFEDYFIDDREYVQKVSPQLFKKIEGVVFYDDR